MLALSVGCWIILITSGIGFFTVIAASLIALWNWWTGQPPGTTFQR